MDKIYEDENFFAFLDIHPINPGHTLLIPKKHCENLYEIPDNLMTKTGPLIKKLAIAVKKGTNANGINLGMNNEKPAGQLIPHAHFHIIPRFINDGHEHWKGQPYLSSKEVKELAQKISQELI